MELEAVATRRGAAPGRVVAAVVTATLLVLGVLALGHAASAQQAGDVLADPYTGTGPATTGVAVGGVVVTRATTTTSPPPTTTSGAPSTTLGALPRIRTQAPTGVVGTARSALAAAIPTISDLDWDVKHVATNVSLMLLLLLLIGLPAEIINSTLKEHYGGVLVGRKLPDGVVQVTHRINSLPNALLLVGFGVVGAVIYAELDPSFGWNRPTLILIAGLAAALVAVSGIFEALRIPYFRRAGGHEAHLRMYPLALVAAVILVALSRSIGFEPGFIFGVTCGLAMTSEINDIEEGRSVALVSIGMLVVSMASWVLWTPVAESAAGSNPSDATLFFDVMLSTLWVSGLQTVLFGLLPMRYLYGLRVMAWSRIGWATIFGGGLLLFISAVLHPSAQVWTASEGVFWTVTGGIALFFLFAIVLWAWFRYVEPRRAAARSGVSASE